MFLFSGFVNHTDGRKDGHNCPGLINTSPDIASNPFMTTKVTALVFFDNACNVIVV